jgi:hypothetical protein
MNLVAISFGTIFAGLVFMTMAQLWLLILVFQGSLLAGLCALVVPPLLIPFALQNWPVARSASLTWCFGIFVLVLGAVEMFVSGGA